MARAARVAVTGPKGIPVAYISPYVHNTTSPTGAIVITPRNQRRLSMAKVTIRTSIETTIVMKSDELWDEVNELTTTSPMMFCDVAVTATPSSRAGWNASSIPVLRAPGDSPALVVTSQSRASIPASPRWMTGLACSGAVSRRA